MIAVDRRATRRIRLEASAAKREEVWYVGCERHVVDNDRNNDKFGVILIHVKSRIKVRRTETPLDEGAMHDGTPNVSSLLQSINGLLETADHTRSCFALRRIGRLVHIDGDIQLAVQMRIGYVAPFEN